MISTISTISFFLAVLIAVQGVVSDDAVQLSESFGGPHGNDFSDQASVVSGQTVTSITIRAGDRVDGVSLGISAPTAQTFTHGGTGGTDNTLTLGIGEYITSMEAHWGEKGATHACSTSISAQALATRSREDHRRTRKDQ
ncbi:hypothetical protein PF005_g9914 [Phytophthora fragariae]|uniref:Jacalin-type lectin domain-containing protein n=1 Tax=Phytophthora fragariae TaxID=53985 RepID=A0A6A3F1R6_9STRA|nr:hypothetical protein PF003_g4661 [Phytophthora fragariae]KAE8939459.1 hypothetical protein PF009_g10688 [Phytophthora fragariae]KAE9012979.1 hypothetical protein PF011_g8677 [Phytophthora fragariae]KAE9110805.1 hypothetical protein PF007_g11727 [Phytophthora fragariae]KAE9115682.1 hypothetical protein PF010_g9245 [Phytophthora fragariae]